jgi:alcohol dehydrogenase class IV
MRSETSMMMQFSSPTKWRHGRGISAEAGEFVQKLGAQKVLLITDPVLLDAGLIETVFSSLKKRGLEVTVNTDVRSEPTVGFFDALASKIDPERFDALVAVGGGSVMDVAKGLRIYAQCGGSIRDYKGFDRIPRSIHLPMLAIPTTSGTGSEVSDGAVFIDEVSQTKFAIGGLQNCPTAALTDPFLTVSMPPMITAISGIDALVHAVEAYVTRTATQVTEMFAMRAIELIGVNLERAHESGDDVDAREGMQIGATLAMIATINSRLGLCHALAMPLCALYHLPHGQACGIVLPYVLAFNSSVVVDKVNRIMHALGYEVPDQGSPKDGFDRLKRLVERLGLTVSLRNDHGFEDSHMDAIVNRTMESFQTSSNPRDVKEEDVRAIVRMIL